MQTGKLGWKGLSRGKPYRQGKGASRVRHQRIDGSRKYIELGKDKVHK